MFMKTILPVQIEKPVSNEPAHESIVLFVLLKLILQSRMRSHPMGLDVWFMSDPSSTSILYVYEQRRLLWDCSDAQAWCFVGPFVYFHTLCVRTANALVRQPGCAGSPEPSLVAYVISTIISWTGSNKTVYIKLWQIFTFSFGFVCVNFRVPSIRLPYYPKLQIVLCWCALFCWFNVHIDKWL